MIRKEVQFENSDESIKFNIERLKLKCEVLRQHIVTCNQRLDEVMQQRSVEFTEDMQILKYKEKPHAIS